MRIITRIKKWIIAAVSAAVLGGGYTVHDLYRGGAPAVRQTAAVVTQKGSALWKELRAADFERLLARFKRAWDAF